MTQEIIEAGYAVFVHDGEKAIGAVREIHRKGKGSLVIYIENAGDFVVPLSAVRDVHAQKVMLDCEKLDSRLLHAVTHAHEAEDPRI